MDSDALDKAFSGITLDGVYANGTHFTEIYREDHTIRYLDPGGADSGEWSIRDGLFCTFYEGQQGACFAVHRLGDNCFTFFEADTAGRATNWSARGWNRSEPTTCPTSPIIAI